ncbi:MAG: periplasmic divalent cation tolerance protein [Saliniramus fredricksonii]|uniref:Divalent cation tolerance protein n=1 Tax=Saliniramus fredricksonii TaxID=1653334 RepID=A0A0P8ABG3_9HYPH|nr:divalent-cation tolerance protein CutA [Saliniramus fredricksonii]KPQ12608.1 MAG: periplasmic divalent cation tolerance protein [Saliniramus fredricksonii]SCC82717.1 divalent cation tolerance protein [Saliniramus fredricksonii]
MDQPLFVYTTFPDVQTARRIAGLLVAEKLCACLNLLPGMHALYRHDGAVAEDTEVAAIVKTRAALADAVEARIRDAHPYDTPVFFRIDVTTADAATRAWLMAETGAT